MAQSNPLPSQEELHHLFRYDPETGELIRRITTGGQLAGSVAGATTTKTRVQIKVGAKFYLAHRLIWRMQTGKDPGSLQIDHINHNPSDNRWSNLRLVTPSENCSYRRVNVGQVQTCGDKFKAKIGHNGKQVYLGVFATEHMARLACLMYAQKTRPGFVYTGA